MEGMWQERSCVCRPFHMSGICIPYVHCVDLSLCGPICQVSLSVHTHSVHDVSLHVHGLHLPVCTWCVLPGVDLSVHGIRLPVFTCWGSFCI